MAITYPLNTPTNIGIANITLMAENAVSISSSPFTYQQQVVAHPGQRWAASISLPPMKRDDAENWVAFLLSLKGQIGTFLLGDPNCTVAQGEAEKNLLIYTEQFDNAAWTKVRATITANTGITTAPDGTNTADIFIEDTATGTHAITESITWVAGQTYTLSMHIKAQSTRNFRMDLPSSIFGGINFTVFNPNTGAVVTSTVGTSPVITPLPDGWYRVSMTNTAQVSGTSSLAFYLVTASSSYTGDGTSGIYLWGAQLELGSVATNYQPVVAGTELVNGAGQTGGTLNIDGCSPSVTGYLMPGDYIQLGSGATTRLHKVLTQVNTDASGQATLDIWPDLRSSPADNAAVTLRNARGRFRLKENITQWNINEMSTYGITFDCVEAL